MTADEFFGLLSKARLFTAEDLSRLARALPAGADQTAQSLAQWFVAQSLLTEFQVQLILCGKGRGLVRGDYEVRDVLGKGGMGTVYLAHDRRNDHLCALKVLRLKDKPDDRHQLRFAREMEVSQRLKHPHIASTYTAGRWGKTPYLAMEYVPGPTLYQLVRKGGVPPTYWLARWLADVADALDYAHQAGVVHRDLKPSNVIITPKGEAMLLDLGLARWFHDDHNEERVVGARRIIGSFDYIAPEQASNSARADARSDIYGVGCLLYFGLAGRPPFSDVEHVRAKLVHHRDINPAPILKSRPDIDPGFADVVHAMMAKNPADRFQVAAEVRDVLLRWATRMLGEKPVEPPALPAYLIAGIYDEGQHWSPPTAKSRAPTEPAAKAADKTSAEPAATPAAKSARGSASKSSTEPPARSAAKSAPGSTGKPAAKSPAKSVTKSPAESPGAKSTAESAGAKLQEPRGDTEKTPDPPSDEPPAESPSSFWGRMGRLFKRE